LDEPIHVAPASSDWIGPPSVSITIRWVSFAGSSAKVKATRELGRPVICVHEEPPRASFHSPPSTVVTQTVPPGMTLM
jgi:hypothetical protein